MEAANQRGTLFEKRRKMKQDWATYCAKSDNVVPLQGKAAA